MPNPTSSRAKHAATLTGRSPQPRATGTRAAYAAQLSGHHTAAQDNTAPERVLGSRAKALAVARNPVPAVQATPAPLVVALSTGRLGVYAPRYSPLDPAGVFTQHVVWLPPSTDQHHAVIRQGHPLPPDISVNLAHLWQRLLRAITDENGGGYIYYANGAHATGNVPTHARNDRVAHVIDITELLHVMDLATSNWEGPRLHVDRRADAVSAALTKEAQAWARSPYNASSPQRRYIVTLLEKTFKFLKSSMGWKSTAENLTQDAEKFLKDTGWTAQRVDSAAAKRLFVRAVLPKSVRYSGRKVNMEQADMQRYRNGVPGETSGSSHYVLDSHGDSVVVNEHFRGTEPIRVDTVKVPR